MGRLGGDEFVALLPEVADERDAERVAQRVLEALREPIFVGGQECFVTASVGVALYPLHGMDENEISLCAGLAVKRAKEAGRDCIALPDRLPDDWHQILEPA